MEPFKPEFEEITLISAPPLGFRQEYKIRGFLLGQSSRHCRPAAFWMPRYSIRVQVFAHDSGEPEHPDYAGHVMACVVFGSHEGVYQDAWRGGSLRPIFLQLAEVDVAHALGQLPNHACRGFAYAVGSDELFVSLRDIQRHLYLIDELRRAYRHALHEAMEAAHNTLFNRVPSEDRHKYLKLIAEVDSEEA